MRFCESAPIDIPVGVFSARLDRLGGMHFTKASQAFGDILQCVSTQPSELSGVLRRLVHPKDRQAFESFLLNAARKSKPVAWNGRLDVEGVIKSIRIDLTPPAKNDLTRIWTGVLQDLTDVKELQDRFESVLDAAQAFTWRRDIRHGQSQFGTRWAKFAKHDEGQTSLPSDDWLAKVHPEDAPTVRAAVQALERGDVERDVLVYRRKLEDGAWVWLRVHAGISERAKDGTPTALAGVSFDVTDEMQQRERITSLNAGLRDELSNARLALERTAYELTENIPVGTYTMMLRPGDELAHFGFMSRRFLEITGLDEDEARADPMRAFACVHPDEYDDWVEKNAHAFVHRLPFREEARLLVNGEVRWIVAESVPRLKEDGTWVWEGVIQDITSQKISERALRRADQVLLENAKQRARLEERERFIRDIHDGFGNQLAIGKLRLRRGEISAEQAVHIIDDCLDDLRLLLDSLDSEGESLWSLLAALEERVQKRTRGLPITIDWNIEAARQIELSPRDMLQAARIVQETLANALRHAEARSIQVTVRVDEGGRYIEVKDDGKGFDVDQTSTGRGLNNMRARAEHNGWQLNIKSNGNGTIVLLEIK